MEERKILYVVLSVALFLFVVLMGVLLYGKTIETDKRDYTAKINNNKHESNQLDDSFEAENNMSDDKSNDETANANGDNEEKDDDIVFSEGSEEAEEYENYMVGANDNFKPSTTPKSNHITSDDDLPPPRTTVSKNTNSSNGSKQVSIPAKEEKIVKTNPVFRKVWINEYWIQAASFKSKYKAEQIKNKLSERNVASRIIPKKIDNEDYYRVRIGPYSNKSEAEKFLSWIHSIEGFRESYISLVPVKKIVN